MPNLKGSTTIRLSKIMSNNSKPSQIRSLALVAVLLVIIFVFLSIILFLYGTPWYLWTIPLLLLITISLLYVGYTWGSNITGFGSYTTPAHDKDHEFQRAKTLWDWLQLLIVSAVLTFLVIWFNFQQNQTNLNLGTQQHNSDNQIAQNQRQDTILASYLDSMSDLLLKDNLHESKPGDEIRNVARAKTLYALHILEPVRKGVLLQFLYEADLISKKRLIINLNLADLSQIKLAGANLDGVDLSGANLNGAQLDNASLKSANLNGADLSHASLSNVQLNCGNDHAIPNCATLSNANLSYANLSYANLSYANLSYSHLDYATLNYAILNFDTLNRTVLYHANLNYVNLNYASLYLANLGSVHLDYAVLKHSNLSHSDLNTVDLRHANLFYADLNHVDFNHSDISYAKLNHVILSYADMSYANLYATEFCYANLRPLHVNDPLIAIQLAEAKTTLGANLDPGIKPKNLSCSNT
jgi:uncharacterized protein YjbI with pentapeptide repeats